MITRVVLRLILVAALTAFFAACGGSSSSPTNASETIGRNGGRVIAESVEVVIPAGAMPTDTTVRIAADSSGSPVLPAWTKAAGAMLQLTPHGGSFEEPVTVRVVAPQVTLKANERLVLAKAQPGGTWEVLGDTELVNGWLETRVQSFSYFVPVIVAFEVLTIDVVNSVPFAMSPVVFSCSGAPCVAPVMLGANLRATSSGNGGQLPTQCVNPQVQLGEATAPVVTVPATPSVVASGQVTWTPANLGATSIVVASYLVCRDPTTDAVSRLRLSSGSITVDSFSAGPATPLVREFPVALSRASGENLSFRATLTRGASYRLSSSTFSAPTNTDQAVVHVERLAVGDSNWRIVTSRNQTAAATGSPAWAYWWFDFDLGPVSAGDNGALYRVRACYQAPTATSVSCSIGPVAALTVVQQTILPAFTQQPASVLVQPGQTASYSALVTGTPTPTLAWQTRASGESVWVSATGNGANTGSFTTGALSLADNGRQYRLVATNVVGTVSSEIVTLLVNAQAVPPTITGQPLSLTVVTGSEAVFAVTATGTAALSYQWLRNGAEIAGANGSQLKLPSVGAGDAATYSVRVSNSAGVIVSSNAVLSVSAAPAVVPVTPSIVTQPAAVAVSEGNVATFAVGVTGTGPISFQWRFNGTAIPGATAAAYTINAVSSAQAGNYSVVVSNAAGSVASAAATLAIVPGSAVLVAPTITTHPVSVVALPISTTTLAVVASGTGPLAYQWFQEGSPITAPGSNGPVLTLESLDAIYSGSYTVRVSNAAGSVMSNPAQLVVVGAPQITAQPQATSVAEGDSATFTVQASGNGLRYQWLRNGIFLQDQIDASLTTPALALSDNGAVYSVLVYNGAGVVMSAGAVLTVSAVPQLTTVLGKMAVGKLHTCAVTAANAAACWGENSGGQIGTGNFQTVYSPLLWSLPEPVQSVAAGFAFSCALTGTTGQVWCSGNVVNALVPTQVPGLSGVIQVAAGAVHACALKADGTVWCWGGGNQYELGNGSNSSSFTPVQVLADVGVPLTNVAAIDATERHTCAIVDTGSGSLHCWGANSYHQLGYDPLGSYPAGRLGYALAVPGLSNIAQVAAGSAHTCALLNNDAVRCWGLNNWGQLGLGYTSPLFEPVTTPTTVPGLSGVGQLATSINHTCAVLLTQTVKCWGTGFLGNNYIEFQTSPVAIAGLSGVLAVDGGEIHSCALRTGGSLRCWGSSIHGGFGNGNTTSSETPVAAGGSLTWWQAP